MDLSTWRMPDAMVLGQLPIWDCDMPGCPRLATVAQSRGLGPRDTQLFCADHQQQPTLGVRMIPLPTIFTA